MKDSWEEINDGRYTERLKVFGGWLVKSYEANSVYDVNRGVNDTQYNIAMAFVPDINHEWKV